MNSNMCYNCGSLCERLAGGHCPMCGSVMKGDWIPTAWKLISEAFALLRESKFDEAKTAFEAFLKKYPESAEAYWGRLCARYHITYVLGANEKMVPKCPTRSGANIFEDADYLKATEYASAEEKAFLQAQAMHIKTACTEFTASKNLVNRFTFGEVDPKDAFVMPPKSKKPLVLTVASLVLIAATVILFITGRLGARLDFAVGDDGNFSVGSTRFEHFNVEIPESYRGKPVTAIKRYAFYESTLLKKIVIPDSVTIIGDHAFDGCRNLTSANIPVGVTKIADCTFIGCENLAGIVIPEGVTDIGEYAFYGCSALTEIVIPDSVTSIDIGAFSHCEGLASIVISDSVTSIGQFVFYGCGSLTSVIIPEGVTSIGELAFGSCYELTGIVIPESVTVIDQEAFSYCRGLTSIEFGGTTAQWSAISFGSSWDDYTGDYTVYCTDGTVAKDGTVIPN